MPSDPIVCPFCPLCCDDVVVQTDGTVDVNCPIAAEQFSAAVRPSAPRLGVEALDDGSVDTIIARLDLPPLPTVDIRHATIGESRVLHDLARDGKLMLASPSTVAASWALATARDGIVSATLGDVLTFADQVICLGDVAAARPRLPEWLAARERVVRHWPVFQLEDLTALRFLCDSQTNDSSADTVDDSFAAIADAARSARYLAILVGDGAFPDDQRDLLCEGLLRWVAEWNASATASEDENTEGEAETGCRRAVALMLADNQSLSHVVRFRDNRTTANQLAPPNDASIRLGGRHPQSDDEQPVLLQIGGVDPGPKAAQAYLPAAMPGVHFADATIRGDGSVTLPITSIATTELPRRVDLLRHVLTGQRDD